MLFLQIFEKILRLPRGSARRNPPRGDPPYKPSLGGPRVPPEKSHAGANVLFKFKELPCNLVQNSEPCPFKETALLTQSAKQFLVAVLGALFGG